MSKPLFKGVGCNQACFNIYGTKIKTLLNHFLLRSKAFYKVGDCAYMTVYLRSFDCFRALR